MFSGDELIPRLRELYQLMDAAYCSVAREVEFSCEGCDGVTCCTVDVTLHTFGEMLYLRRGFNALATPTRTIILGRCREMLEAKRDDPLGDAYRNAVCAVNFDGLCGLYEYRPMICRLAGIRHVIVRPDGSSSQGKGCLRYENEILPHHLGPKIDRTGFYRAMAEMEMDVVRSQGKRTATRTIAETIALEDAEGSLS